MTAALLGASELHALVVAGEVRVIDATVHLSFDENGAHVASGAESFAAGHIPGAVFIDQITQTSAADGEAPFEAASSEVFAAAVGAAGISNADRVVIYDSVNGIWATRLWWQFRLEGFEAEILDGGLAAWEAAGFAVSTEATTYPPAVFSAVRRPGAVVSTADVVAATTDESVLLINGLDDASFAAGHIPSSVNVPFASLVNEDGTLKDLSDVRAAFEAVGALDPSVRPVAYCGGGIAATALTFALAAVGRDDVAVYDGSMNAWTADPARPLATRD